MILSIDGGTTNTRLYLVEKGSILSVKKLHIGIRNTMQAAGKDQYIKDITEAVNAILQENPMLPEAIICSGMIGSETGLYTCPHIHTPILPTDLANAMHHVTVPGWPEIPCWFIPGVKTFSQTLFHADNIPVNILDEMDIMRGEETELAGISAKLGLQGERVFLLPGSHMKIVSFNSKGEIESFHTSITGELLRAAADHTILQASLGGIYPQSVDKTFLQRGYELARKSGVMQAMFKVRILDKSIGGTSAEKLYAFLMGICLQPDVDDLVARNCPVCIAGSDPFRNAYAYLLTLQGISVQVVSQEVSEYAVPYGAEWIWQHMDNTMNP